MTQPDATQLHQFLVDHFDLDELETLCLHLRIKYDDLGGKGLTGKARELVLYAERHGRLVDLRAVLGQQRPDLYQAAFGEAATPRRDRRHAERNPKQIFVSHAVADGEEFAHRLADDLRRADYTIWIAPESIPDGQWVSAINRGLAESGVMLLVLTPGALESPWVEMETNVAIELERAGEMRFIPVCLQWQRYDPMWHAYQWVMFEQEYAVGLKNLLAVLSPSAHNRHERGLRIDATSRRVIVDGQMVPLRDGREMDVLLILNAHRGQVVTYRQLVEQVFGEPDKPYDEAMLFNDKEALQRLIARLCERIDPQRIYITNKHGVGYKLSAEDG